MINGLYTIRRKRLSPLALMRLKVLKRVAKAITPVNGWRRNMKVSDFHPHRQRSIHWLIRHEYIQNNPLYLMDGRVLDCLELTAIGRYACETGRL